MALLVGSLLVLGLSGCDKGEKRKLTEVEAPVEGITLAYDLTPGQTYDGNIRMRNTINSPMGDVIQTLEFDVVLLTSGVGSEDRQLMIATVDDIGFDMRLPDGVPAEAAGGLNSELAAQLNGVELRFQLDRLGEVSEMPDPPKDQPPAVQAMLGMLAGALGSSFVRVPGKPIKQGESWDAAGTPQAGQEGLVQTGSGTFKSMARDTDRNEDLVKLALSGKTEGTMEANGKQQKVSSEQKADVLFSVTAGFPAKVARKRSGDAGGFGTMLIEVDADWTKGERRPVQAPPPVVQEITDPCDPDYVGPEDCVDEDEAAEAPADE
jgi:hypothetical protein